MVSFECNPMYVEDVKDRSNTPKAVMLCMSKISKMSKIDQIHLRAVMSQNVSVCVDILDIHYIVILTGLELID